MDTSFDSDGIVTTDIADGNDRGGAVAVQTDGEAFAHRDGDNAGGGVRTGAAPDAPHPGQQNFVVTGVEYAPTPALPAGAGEKWRKSKRYGNWSDEDWGGDNSAEKIRATQSSPLFGTCLP